MTKRNRGKRNNAEQNQQRTTELNSKDLEKLLDQYASEVLGEPTHEKVESCNKNDNIHESENISSESLRDPDIPSIKSEPEIVVFHTNKWKKYDKSVKLDKYSEPVKLKKATGARPVKSKYTNERLNSAEVLKKLKFDVSSFGQKAFSKEQQRELERQRAIKLGAIAPKKKPMNYREFLEQQKEKKESAETEDTVLTKRKARKPVVNPQFWKEGNKSYSAQVGKYRDGVLKLSSKEIKSIKKQR